MRLKMTSEGEIKEQFPSYLFDTEQASLVFLTRISMHVYYTACSPQIGRLFGMDWT